MARNCGRFPGCVPEIPTSAKVEADLDELGAGDPCMENSDMNDPDSSK
jgi:hypothetical protein